MSFSVGIVGGSGLIARSIWQTYSTRTDTRVHLFARSRPEGLRDGVEYTKIDLIKDQPLPAAIFNCDLLINASSSVDGDANAMRLVNIEGVRRLAVVPSEVVNTI